MAQMETWIETDLKKPIEVRYLKGVVFTQDNQANKIGVRVYSDGEPVSLGGTVSANIIRGDGATLAQSGTVSGNEAYVILPAAAYAYKGIITVVIKITVSSVITTIGAVVGTVYESSTSTIVDPGTVIPSVAELIAEIDAAIASIPADYSSLWTSLAPAYSTSGTYTVGQYVTYNGKVYRCVSAISSGESWTAAHWTETKIGNELSDLKSALINNEIINIFKDGTYQNSTWRGVTLTWNGKIATLSGKATGGNFTSPNIFNNSSAFPDGISAGEIINVNLIHNTDGVYVEIYSYVNGSLTNSAQIYDSQKYKIPNNATGMLIRLFVPDGTTVNGTFSFEITKSALVSIQEKILPTILPAKDSIVDVIESTLTKYGIVVLGKGTYTLTRPITMPDNSIIKGAGESTVINAVSGQYGIIVGANCSIQDVRIHSESGYSTARGSGSGIKVIGNHESAPLKYNIKIDNVTIDGFGEAGIYGTATGTWVADSISATNCRIFNCYAGLLLEDYSEFGRYTNILCYSCYIGLLNKSGNNVFVNCSFSNNTVGVYLIGDDGDNSRNNGHGTLVGCTINHSNNNSGFAVICRGINANGFIFDSCQIWYGKIQVEQSSGIVFENCMIGAYNTDTEIINYTANDLFLINCLFKVGAAFSGSGGETHAINCFKFDGTPISNE